MKLTRSLIIAGLVLPAAAIFAQDTDKISVDRIAICTAVADREPQGEGAAFDTSVPTLCCFTALNGPAGKIIHAWYHGDSLRAKITLNKGKEGRWRTHSTKKMAPEWKGQWRVDVLDENDNVLKSAAFTYGKTEN